MELNDLTMVPIRWGIEIGVFEVIDTFSSRPKKIRFYFIILNGLHSKRDPTR